MARKPQKKTQGRPIQGAHSEKVIAQETRSDFPAVNIALSLKDTAEYQALSDQQRDELVVILHDIITSATNNIRGKSRHRHYVAEPGTSYTEDVAHQDRQTAKREIRAFVEEQMGKVISHLSIDVNSDEHIVNEDHHPERCLDQVIQKKLVSEVEYAMGFGKPLVPRL